VRWVGTQAVGQNRSGRSGTDDDVIERFHIRVSQVRSVFLVTLIPCALSHFLCSSCALVNAAVLGSSTVFAFGRYILMVRDISLSPFP
jgi:hypothetical protein